MSFNHQNFKEIFCSYYTDKKTEAQRGCILRKVPQLIGGGVWVLTFTLYGRPTQPRPHLWRPHALCGHTLCRHTGLWVQRPKSHSSVTLLSWGHDGTLLRSQPRSWSRIHASSQRPARCIHGGHSTLRSGAPETRGCLSQAT